MNKLIEKYLEYERMRGMKAPEKRGHELTPLFKFLNIIKKEFYELDFKGAQDFQTYLATMEDKEGRLHYSTYSVRTMITEASRFYNYLKDIGKVHSNPFLGIKRIKVEKFLPKNLPDEKTMNDFLNYLSEFWKHKGLNERRYYYKVHVVAELMYSTGLRIGEVMALKTEDIDFENRIVNVKHGKGDRERYAYLNEYAARVLKIYCDEMIEVIKTNKKTVEIFGIRNATNVTDVIHKYLNLAGKQFGIVKFTSHGFRHSLGFHLLRRGCDMRYIQLILGHEDMNSTVIYTKVEKSDLKSELDTYHPRQEEQ